MSKVAITGATGMVGRALTKQLEKSGHSVVPISRSVVPNGIQWDLEKMTLDASQLEGVEAVIHLAGSGIAEGRWTAARKKVIRSSRIDSARLLIESIERLKERPKVFISASGVGYYGIKHGEPVDEQAPLGNGFLAEVCRDWEAEAQKAESLGLRVAIARFGVILSPEGGALAKMLPPFKLGLGGPVGSGKQRLGWIALDDAVHALEYLLSTDEAFGPFNLTAPEIVTNSEFASALGNAVGKPAKIPAPAFALKLAFGEMAEETLLADAPIVPARLRDLGFKFAFPKLSPALEHLLAEQND
ncbi:MAG: TIGR01777 family oxidoreductase [Verrucomicrobiota bacterium]